MRWFVRFQSSKSLFRCAILLAALFVITACVRKWPSPDYFEPCYVLTLLHTNDTHSSYGGTTEKGLTCYGALCEGGRGGYVRLDQAVRAIRRDNPDALFLDAGDIFQGTLFWTLHKERMPMALVDRMGYQAIIPGNHEFDDGWKTWLRMVDALETPVLAANVSFSPRLKSPGMDKIRPFTVLERNGRQIGIIGVVTRETRHASAPGAGVRFNDEQKTVEDAVKELSAQGVNIIIALTHLGLENDRRLARTIDGVDVIVGGHSHSLLSKYAQYDPKAEGPYPMLEQSPDGSPVLVVTASTACAYLGMLSVGFDDAGVVRSWDGQAIPLDQEALENLGAPEPDPALVDIIEDFAVPVLQMMGTSIGSIEAQGRDGKPLEEPNVLECRKGECLSGNIAADSLRTVPFERAQIAVINGGALRNSLPGGGVSPGDVLAALPFQNTAVIAKMPGSVLLEALEHSVAAYGENQGRFLQVSGLRYTIRPSNPPGRRISGAEARGKNGKWRPLEPNAVYEVVTVDFLAKGGDGFSMLTPLRWEEGDKLANDVLRMYLEKYSPVRARLEGRITVEQ